MSRPGDRSTTSEIALAALGLLAAVALGALWTGTAIAAGDTPATVVRFALSLAAGFYYLVLYRVATGRTLALR